LDKQCINGSDLYTPTAAGIADLGGCDVVLFVGLKKGEPRKTLHELVPAFGACKTLQHFLKHQSGSEDLLGAQESGTESANFRQSRLDVTAKGQRPHGSVDQQTHRWRSRSVL
jgi:hypothetical protein